MLVILDRGAYILKKKSLHESASSGEDRGFRSREFS